MIGGEMSESPELWKAINAVRDGLDGLAREQAAGLARIETHIKHQEAETARNTAALNGNGNKGLKARVQDIEGDNAHRDRVLKQEIALAIAKANEKKAASVALIEPKAAEVAFWRVALLWTGVMGGIVSILLEIVQAVTP